MTCNSFYHCFMKQNWWDKWQLSLFMFYNFLLLYIWIHILDKFLIFYTYIYIYIIFPFSACVYLLTNLLWRNNTRITIWHFTNILHNAKLTKISQYLTLGRVFSLLSHCKINDTNVSRRTVRDKPFADNRGLHEILGTSNAELITRHAGHYRE